jgi:hypothetical protein
VDSRSIANMRRVGLSESPGVHLMRFDDGHETEERCEHRIGRSEFCPICDEPMPWRCGWCGTDRDGVPVKPQRNETTGLCEPCFHKHFGEESDAA